MNIYDEALNGLEAIRKELQDRLNFPVNLTPEYRSVKKALERAKKVEELFGLYREHMKTLTENAREGVKGSMFSAERVAYELYQKIKALEEELK